ncbi:MAG: 2-dehydro-3-deoxygalactonokinase [Caldimonas sp.]
MAEQRALIALDWGSSSLRAYLMSDAGKVLETRSSDDGASRLSVDVAVADRPAVFERHLRSLVPDWLASGPPVLACGMVGSAHGWCEADYLECPVDIAALHERLVAVEGSDGLRVRIVPGVSRHPVGAAPDVMRGEETQVAGVLARDARLANGVAWIVLPGTHSKWVKVENGRIVSFATRMTGELFELLRSHSVLGRSLAPSTTFDADAFERGCTAARVAGGADVARLLFGVRTLGLFGRMPATSLVDYLSGVLIGAELAAALVDIEADVPLVLAGDERLCDRYRRGLAHFGRSCDETIVDASALGLWQIARAASGTARRPRITSPAGRRTSPGRRCRR